jgi:REP element-mobilizing transposase RayT
MAFWRLYYHLIWATRDRAHLIEPKMESNLYGYLIHKASESGVYVYAVNGWYDHIHLVVSVPPKLAIAEVVKRLKGASAHHFNNSIQLDYEFAWQRGYGVFSLGEKQRALAEEYVREQKAHHDKGTTNSWLERCAELDEGPWDTGLNSGPIPRVIREKAPDYGLEMPF